MWTLRTIAALLVLVSSALGASPPCPENCRCTMTCLPTTTTSTSTTTTSTVGVTTTLAPGCTGPRSVIAGLRHTTYRPTIPPRGSIDATAATFLAGPDNKYAIQVKGGPGGCWRGGLVQGTFPRTLTWGEMHSQYNPTAFRIEVPGFLLEGLRIDNFGDGIKVKAENFTIRGVHLTWGRDDALENTSKHSGLLEDALVESTYVGISTRGDEPAASDAVITIRDTLLGLVPMPGPHESEDRDPGHGGAFKIDTTSPAFVLEDNVFFASQQTNSEGGIGVPDRMRIKSCARNVLVYTGTEPLDLNHLGKDPVSKLPCFTVSRDRRVWDDAVSAWKATH